MRYVLLAPCGALVAVDTIPSAGLAGDPVTGLGRRPQPCIGRTQKSREPAGSRPRDRSSVLRSSLDQCTRDVRPHPPHGGAAPYNRSPTAAVAPSRSMLASGRGDVNPAEGCRSVTRRPPASGLEDRPAPGDRLLAQLR